MKQGSLTNGPAQTFHLLGDATLGADRVEGNSCQKKSASGVENFVLEIPVNAPAYLKTDRAGSVELSTRKPKAEPFWVCQAVYHKGQPCLLVLGPENWVDLKINGQPATRVELLCLGDQIQLGSRVFHVNIFNRPQLGPAGQKLAGQECVYCRTPFTPETFVYRCPCGRVFHCEPESQAEAADTLACARNISECPHCQRRIQLEEGYLYAPPR